MERFMMAVTLVAVMWWATIATVRFLQERKERSKKRAPKVGDKVEILSGEFKWYIGTITEIGANHNNNGSYCWVMKPDGAQERFIYPNQIRLISQSVEVSSIGGEK